MVMNLQNIVNQKEEHALVIYSHVIMEIVYQEFIFVMVIMIAWITVMKMIDINAVSRKYYLNLLIYRIKTNIFVIQLDNRKCEEETEFTCDENKSWGRSQCISKKW